MAYEWIDAFCVSLPGACRSYQPDWEAMRYLVGGKMFAMTGRNKQGLPIVTLKLEPAFGRLLRQQYPNIVPGYYMNKEHWNSVSLEGTVPDEALREMLTQAHDIVLHSLRKKLQREITGQTPETARQNGSKEEAR